jgi:hypothetical protein
MAGIKQSSRLGVRFWVPAGSRSEFCTHLQSFSTTVEHADAVGLELKPKGRRLADVFNSSVYG